MLVVVTMIAMVASMAIPRMSRATGAASESALAGDLALIRRAILLYAIEHANAFPGPTADRFVEHLTQYSTMTGQTSATRTSAYIYGPYLNHIPPCPLGPKQGNNTVRIDSANSPPKYSAVSSAGWLYNPVTGEFYANVPADDVRFVTDGAHLAGAQTGL